MWVKELLSTDTCNLKNVVTLVAGILKIPTQEIIVQLDEMNIYHSNMSVMLFTKEGQAKFKNQEEIDNCAKTYFMLSR